MLNSHEQYVRKLSRKISFDYGKIYRDLQSWIIFRKICVVADDICNKRYLS